MNRILNGLANETFSVPGQFLKEVLGAWENVYARPDARVRPTRRIAQVEALLDEFGQAEAQGQGGRQDQSGIGHQAAVIKGDADAVGVVAWQHLVS